MGSILKTQEKSIDPIINKINNRDIIIGNPIKLIRDIYDRLNEITIQLNKLTIKVESYTKL